MTSISIIVGALFVSWAVGFVIAFNARMIRMAVNAA